MSQKVLHYIHIGKCGGSTLNFAIRNSNVIALHGFQHFLKTHISVPIYHPSHSYLIVIRNPIQRAISAFNWRHKLVVGDEIQKNRFSGEWQALKKYETLNNLCLELYNGDEINLDAANHFRTIHHLKEDISFYLRELLPLLSPSQIFGVLTQEFLDDDIERCLGVTNEKREKVYSDAVSNERKTLDDTATLNLRRFLIEDYKCIAGLYCLGAIQPSRLYQLMR